MASKKSTGEFLAKKRASVAKAKKSAQRRRASLRDDPPANLRGKKVKVVRVGGAVKYKRVSTKAGAQQAERRKRTDADKAILTYATSRWCERHAAKCVKRAARRTPVLCR